MKRFLKILLTHFASFLMKQRLRIEQQKAQFAKTSILLVLHHGELISHNYESKLPYNILSVCCSIQHV